MRAESAEMYSSATFPQDTLADDDVLMSCAQGGKEEARESAEGGRQKQRAGCDRPANECNTAGNPGYIQSGEPRPSPCLAMPHRWLQEGGLESERAGAA